MMNSAIDMVNQFHFRWKWKSDDDDDDGGGDGDDGERWLIGFDIWQETY